MRIFQISPELITPQDIPITLSFDAMTIIWVLINVIVIGINIYMQFALKRKDANIVTLQITEQQRISIHEKIFKLMCIIANVTLFEDANTISNKISTLRNHRRFDALYLSEKILDNITEFCDYFDTVILDVSLRDFKKEQTLFETFKSEFKI